MKISALSIIAFGFSISALFFVTLMNYTILGDHSMELKAFYLLGCILFGLLIDHTIILVFGNLSPEVKRRWFK